MSMIKVTYSSDISSTVGVGGEIVKSASELGKQAETIFKVDYDKMKPPKGMTGIHLVALGDSEAYPMNRNGDLFPMEACKKYYDTFVEHGHVFEHHRNKDPKKAIGKIVAAAYNPEMHRIELYIWADNEKAHDHLERLEKTGEVSFSMACRVPNDRCFTKGTLVLTSEGFKPIELIKKGDCAITLEANERTITTVMRNTATELTRVAVRGVPDEIECTPNHPFNVVSRDKIRSCMGTAGGKKRRNTPKDGMTKCAYCGRTIDVSSEWKRADELVEGDYIKEKIDPSSESPIRGTSFAYICGMYVGDGCPIWQVSGHGKSGETSSVIGLSISASEDAKDVCIIDRIKAAFRACTGKDATVWSEHGGKKAVVVHLNDALLARRVVSLVGSYSREKHISSEVLGWSKDEKAAFVAGYFDADGHIGLRGGHHIMRICSVNKGLLLSVQRIAWSLGIRATVGMGNTIESFKRDSGFVHKSASYHLFFNQAPEKMVAYSGKLTRDYNDDLSGNRGNSVLIIDGYAYLPVSSSRTFHGDEVSVYNFEVEGEHTYIAEGVGVHNCSVCNAIREKPGDKNECDHIKYSLGKIAEDGTQIGTYNDEPKWFDISFVGRPADRIAWNLKVASSMPEDLTINSSVKQAEIEGYVLPDDLAIESDLAKRKHSVMKKLADAYSRCESWLSGDVKPASCRDRYEFELMKLAGASIDDNTLSRLREMDPANAFAALGDAGVVLNARSFFKYAFGQDYGTAEKYLHDIEKAVPEVVKEAVDTSSCAEFCNYGRFDAASSGVFARRTPRDISYSLSKSAAAMGFGTDDAVGAVLSVVAAGAEPSFRHSMPEKTAGDNSVARKLAKKYAMYKIAAICAVMDGKCASALNEDDVVLVSAAQDLMERN